MIGVINCKTGFSLADIQAQQTLANSLYLSESNANTTWGFQPFYIPSNVVNVPNGGDVQAAINSLPAEGGTVNLASGSYLVNDVRFISNVVLQGAGIGLTTLSFDTSGTADRSLLYGIASTIENSNIIIRDMSVDCAGNGNANGIEMNDGCQNMLIENVKVYNAGKSNLSIYNYNKAGESVGVTFRNVVSYGAGIHGLSMRYVTSALVDNCEAYNNTLEHGLDLSSVNYGEVVGMNSHNNNYGSKFPNANWIYIHDSIFDSNTNVGMNILRSENASPLMHMHLEDNTITNSGSGIVDWGDSTNTPNHVEFVVRNNTITGNTYNTIRLNGVVAGGGHEYGTNIGSLVARSGDVNPIQHTNGIPADHNVGYTQWISEYIEDVPYPLYDNTNPTHLLITPSNGKWTSANLNNATYTHFYVQAGDYKGASEMYLTRDGTATARRYMILYDPAVADDRTHAGKLADADRAKIWVFLNGASYWTFDRMTTENISGLYSYALKMENGASNNIVNNHYIDTYEQAITITDTSHYNTVQNCRIQGMTSTGVSRDRVAVACIFQSSGTDSVNIYGTKIINNEIKNSNDGIQMVRHSNSTGGWQHVDYRGTKIVKNTIWNEDNYAETIHNGSQQPENAIDIKGGSDDPADPMIIQGNVMWGWAKAITMHYQLQYVTLEDNTIFHSQNAMTCGDKQTFNYSMIDCTIRNNTYYKVGDYDPQGRGTAYEYLLYLQDTNNTSVYGNTMIGHSNSTSKVLITAGDNLSFDFSDNAIMTATTWGSPPASSIYYPNWYYESTVSSYAHASNEVYASTSSANMADLTVTYDNFIGAPKNHILTDGETTQSSPHFGQI